MINIVTKYDGDNLIRDFESFFESFVLAEDFQELDLEVLKVIDSAVLLDKTIGTIRTKFGVTDILHLSTGCKIVLSYLHISRNEDFHDNVLDITESGSNALEMLFECADRLNDSDSIFLLRHQDGLSECSDRLFSVNGSVADSLYEGVILYGRDV